MRGRVISTSALLIGFAFLYVPILSMVVYSFNNSRLVTVWDAQNSPTLKWYGLLFANDPDPKQYQDPAALYVVRTSGDYLGHAVNKAARIASAAAGGETMVSQVTRELVGSADEFAFGEPCSCSLKGLDGPHVLVPLIG